MMTVQLTPEEMFLVMRGLTELYENQHLSTDEQQGVCSLALKLGAAMGDYIKLGEGS